MVCDYDTTALRALVAHVSELPADRRLEALKRAVIEHGGRWDLPSDAPGLYQPIMVSVQVLGICAFAADVDELPRNWIRAAENALGTASAHEQQEGRPHAPAAR